MIRRAVRTGGFGWPAFAAVAAALSLASLASPACAGRTAARGPAPAASDSRAVFLARVDEYIAVHTAASDSLPPLPSDATAEQIDSRQRALARLIEQRRAGASPGDLFTPRVRAYFRSQLRRALSGADGEALHAAILDDNPGRVRLRVNARYPESVPLSTMPYEVLAALPPLPSALEYRFLGRRLVLLDTHAYLVVDYMDDALPR